MAKTAKLTEKQQRFVEEYLIDLNATQAAIRAGYSAKTADQSNCRRRKPLHDLWTRQPFVHAVYL